MKKLVFLLLAGVASVCTAHHGTSGQFDQSKSLQISGTVTKIRFVNPHSYVYFDAVNQAGEVENWRCEMRASTVLKRSGWTEEMFKPGTKIKIDGVPAFREPTGCYVNTVEFDDGEVVERYEQLKEGIDYSKLDRPARLASGEPNISGDWAAPQRLPTEEEVRATALGTGPGGPRRGGSRYSQTPAGTDASAGYEREDNPRFHCLATNILIDWIFDQNINRIEQIGNTVTMTYGFMDIVRTIHMDMKEHPAEFVPSRAGHSTGHWDGDTLVVDTVGFEEGYLDTRSGIRHSNQLHMVERFTLDPETMELTREYEGNDSAYLTVSFSGSDTIFPSETPYVPYNCEDLTEEIVDGF